MGNKSSQCSFNTICIAESLSDSEPKTGTQLFNDLKSWIQALRTGIGVSHISIETTASIMDWLECIKKAVVSQGCIPIIHIEAHGSEEGIQLNSGEFVPWKHMAGLLREINIHTKNNLLIVVSACFGAHGIHIADVLEITPFFGIIGPNIEVTSRECAQGYQRFYQSLLKNLNLTQARQELNFVLDDDKKNFQFHSAQDLFIEASIAYLKNHHSSKALRERTEGLVTRILESPVGDKFTPTTARDFVKQKFKDGIQDFIEDIYSTFMMLDQFPENQGRFELSFIEIIEILEKRRKHPDPRIRDSIHNFNK